MAPANWESRFRFGFLLVLVDVDVRAIDIGKYDLDGDSERDVDPSLGVRLPLGAQLLPVNGSAFNIVVCDLDGDADGKL